MLKTQCIALIRSFSQLTIRELPLCIVDELHKVNTLSCKQYADLHFRGINDMGSCHFRPETALQKCYFLFKVAVQRKEKLHYFEPISTLSECRFCLSLALNLIISVWEVLDHHLFQGK
jgi:hypothetical protein